MQVDPPFAANVEAAIDMPPGIARIIGTGKADHEQARMVTRTPSTGTNEFVKRRVEARCIHRPVEWFFVPGRMSDYWLGPCFR